LDPTVTNDVLLTRDLMDEEENCGHDIEDAEEAFVSCDSNNQGGGGGGGAEPRPRPEWFCVQRDAFAYYAANRVYLMEYKL